MRRFDVERNETMTLFPRAACILGHALLTVSTEEGQAMLMAADTKAWTIEKLHDLPDDGNKYELVRGELFVTPAPSPGHEFILGRLTRLLEPYVAEQKLGVIYHPRSVVQFEGSEVEPDLTVRHELREGVAWDKQPTPILVVEVISRSTRRRDHGAKREFYVDAGVLTYWIVDRETRTITVIETGRDRRVESDHVSWSPPGASAPFALNLSQLFG